MKDQIIEEVFCPLIDANIEDIDCIENRDVVDGLIKEDSMPTQFSAKPNWRDICLNCKWHNY